MLSDESAAILAIENSDEKTIVLFAGPSQKTLSYGELSQTTTGSHEIQSIEEIVSLNDDQLLVSAGVSDTGEIIYCTLTEDAIKTRCFVIDANNQQKEIDIDEKLLTTDKTIQGEYVNTISHLDFIDQNSILVGDYFGSMSRINLSSGAILASYDTLSDAQIVDYVLVENELITILAEFSEDKAKYSVQRYSCEDGEFLTGSSSFSAAIESILPAGSHSVSEVSPPAIALQNNKIYVCVGEEVFTIDEHQNTSMLGSGDNNSFSNTRMIPTAIVPHLENEGFYALYLERGNISSPYKLCSYMPEAAKPATETLTVYMLEEHREVSQAIASFKEKNKDVDVITKIGIPAGSDLSAEDAIKQLNLDMMSGDAPDVIVLDGLSVEQMQKENLLLDIGDILEKTKNSDYFENVVAAYENEDGSCYAIPTRVTAPSAILNEELFSQIRTLEDFTTAATSYDDEKETLLGMFPDIYSLYVANHKNIVKDDGSLSEEELSSFFKQSSEIVNTAQSSFNYYRDTLPEKDYDVIGDSLEGFNDPQSSYIIGGLGLLSPTTGEQGIIGTVVCAKDFASVAITENCSDNNLTFGLLEFDEQQVFIPQATIGISSASANTETAKAFVDLALSTEQQSSNQWIALPVSKQAFMDALYKQIEDDGGANFVIFAEEGTEFSYGPLTDAEMQAYIDILDKAEAPYYEDRVITNLIQSELESYLRGQKSLEEASATVYKKASLYMLE